MLPPSKLMPLTIAGIAVILSMKAYALATTMPAPAAFRDGVRDAVSVMGDAGVIGQAHAASNSSGPRLSFASAVEGRSWAVPVSTRAVQGGAGQAAAAGAKPVAPDVAPSSTPGVVTSAPASTAPTPAPAARTAPAGLTAGDLAGLKRSQAEERERDVVLREATITAAEKRLSDRVAELVSLQQRLQGLESGLKERDEANWAGLVKLYEGMKPHEAASIFNALDKPILLDILDRMKPAKASPILAAMDAERARQVTADLAAKRTKSTTASN